MKYRRINIFGGPGVGKSICAAKLFGDLKLHGYLIEQVSEYAKTWAHQKRAVDVFTQLYFLAKQVKSERECLTNGYELIVTNSPLGPCPLYTSENFPKDAEWATASMWGYTGNGCRISPVRHFNPQDSDIKYETNGCYQDLREVLRLDARLREMSEELGGSEQTAGFTIKEYDRLLAYVVEKLRQ